MYLNEKSFTFPYSLFYDTNRPIAGHILGIQINYEGYTKDGVTSMKSHRTIITLFMLKRHHYYILCLGVKLYACRIFRSS